MARKSLTPKQSLFVGITLFSMFFGAGNLILPPLLGLQAGASAVPAMAGFLVTGIGLPMLGIIAVGLAGTIRELASRVHPVFAHVFVAAVYLAIGPCLAIPRTSSTSFEMFEPLLPATVSLETARLVFSVAFFAVALLLAMHPNALTKLLGRITGPALIVLLVFVIGSALFDPAPSLPAAQGAYAAAPAMSGFLTGYQTMDLLASLTFGIVIAANIRELGITDDGGLVREVSRAGVFAGLLMGVIYCGLAVVGVNIAADLPGATNGAEILAASAGAHFGTAGTVVVAVIFLLACLNVCIGLISCCGSYFADEFPRVPYRAWAIGFAVFSCAVSNFGLDAILTFSVPLLNALYPMAIVLVLMGMMHKGCDLVPCAWPWAVGLTSVVSVATALRDAFFAGAWLLFDALPFADMGMNWVVPALVGMAIGVAASGWRRGGADAA
ncbi:branched-chain amino acid transport system II carrier protein [Collinsella phocaeensis]|uniref:branched-chain amino acid transport system II carrier protein n=1 Tax=Collinsella phocaeensis TaxID=1871016 RepID=UPI0009FB82CE|nr:branched-chain amino acid transport system II carrier protein [Collinsella phocaeensis]